MKKDEGFRVFADENLAYVEGEDASEIRSDPAFHILPDKNGEIPRKGPYEAFEEIQYDKSKFPLIDGPKTTPESEWTCGRKDLTFRSMAEINDLAELFENPEAVKKTLAVYRPSRLALHEAIVAVSTMVRCKDEDDMRSKVEVVHPAVATRVKEIEGKLKKDREKLYKQASDLVNKLSNGKDIGESPLACIVKEKYDIVMNAKKEPAMGAFEAAVVLSRDELYTNMASDMISKMARTEVENAIKAGQMEALSIPDTSDRIGFMMFGGPGAGKSTSKAVFDDMLGDIGLTTEDAVVVNTDSYRYLLSDKNVGNMDFSTITYLESAAIRDKVFNRLCALNEEGRCPHCLFDQVYPSMRAINFSTDKEGKARMEGVARYVVTALWAAKKRGDETNRYVDTVNLLELHQDACKELPKILVQSMGKKLVLTIGDNNKFSTDKNNPVISETIFKANMLNNTVDIVDVEKFYKYILNVAINPQAKDKSEIYDCARTQSIDKYLEPVRNAGITINYPKDYLDPKYIDKQKAACYAMLKYKEGKED